MSSCVKRGGGGSKMLLGVKYVVAFRELHIKMKEVWQQKCTSKYKPLSAILLDCKIKWKSDSWITKNAVILSHAHM